MPLYNKAPYVGQAIASALAQTRPPSAVYVADDASTDGSREIVAAAAERDPRIRLLTSASPVPRGAGHARNRAVAAGASEFVAFLDADDYWEPRKLEAQLPLFADRRIGTVHCGTRWVSVDGTLLREHPTPPTPPAHLIFDEVRLARYFIAGSASTLVTRRSVLARAGRFREDIHFAEDWDMWARLVEHGGFDAVPSLLSSIRTHDTIWQSAADEDRFARWLGVLDRWQTDAEFMRRAEAEARGILARHQLPMILQPKRMLVDYPRHVAQHGGVIGQRLYGTRAAHLYTLATLVPALLTRAVQKLNRLRA